ncbi:MAG: archease [Cyanobacteria bacterium NC_groundwater_1444_Ag_S-0.65um_54_12]|nr:archease [Cyanobacteria bacterium NC_groundwater_1444_Ag_S-0.65um_54_12]
MMTGFEILEHPADIGVAFWAPELSGAFLTAAQGLVSLLGGCESLPQTRSVAIHVEGSDRLELLYNWLSEILYYFDGEDFLLSRCQIKQLDEHSLDAECTGVSPPTSTEDTYDVKAITYHQLALDRSDDGWRGRFYVDI